MVWILIGAVAAAATPDHARALFDRMVELDGAYDPASLDLFADDATFVATRDGGDGA